MGMVYPVKAHQEPNKAHDTYGSQTQQSGTSQTVFGFTGEETDSNGLVNLRARYYNPVIGQFFSLDPLEGDSDQPLSLNRNVYVMSNPLNWIDPSGMIYENPSLWNPCLAKLRLGQCDCSMYMDDPILFRICQSNCSNTSWPATIKSNSVIPAFTSTHGTCSNKALIAQREPCAVDQFVNGSNIPQGQITWAQLISMTIVAEGYDLITGTCCSRVSKTSTPTPFKQSECGSTACDKLKQQFLHAAVEQLYNKCSQGGTDGTCTEENLAIYLSGLQVWYTPGKTNYNTQATTHQADAANVLDNFSSQYHHCPCSWGDVPRDTPGTERRDKSYGYYIEGNQYFIVE